MIRPAHAVPRLALLAMAALLLSLLPWPLGRPQAATAATGDTLLVTKTADTNDGVCNADCSLREAVVAANTAAGAQTILLPPGIFAFSIPHSAPDAASGDLDLTDQVTIRGAGPLQTFVEPTRNLQVRAFRVKATASISDLTIRNANAAGGGGGIFVNQGQHLTVDNVRFTLLESATTGGAIDNAGVLTVTNALFYANTARVSGGGIFSSGSATITNATFSGNQGNTQASSSEGGGALSKWGAGMVTLKGVTVSANFAHYGNGLYRYSGAGEISLMNSIIAGNSARGVASPSPDCYGQLTSLGYNLVGNSSGCTGLTNRVNGDKVGTSGAPINPLLNAELALNGGQLETYALLVLRPDLKSPAIDAANTETCPATDQRGRHRPADGDGNTVAACDMGAYELQSSRPRAYLPLTLLPNLPLGPAGLAATPRSGTSVALSWSAVAPGTTSLVIERQAGDSFTQIELVPATASGTVVGGLSPNMGYVFRVRELQGQTVSSAGSTVSISTPAEPPVAPADLAISEISSASMRLTWSDRSSNEVGFYVEQSANGAAFTQVKSLGANVTTVVVDGLSPATNYAFRVRAYNAQGVSGYSPVASASSQATARPPSPPSDLTAIPVSDNRIDLSWIDNADNETGFIVEESADGITFTPYDFQQANLTSAYSFDLQSDIVYYYRIRTYNAAGSSTYSNIASARTQPPPGHPATPSDLTAEINSDNTVTLRWTDRATNETGVELEWSSDGRHFTRFHTLGANATSTPVDGLTPNVTYYFRIRAVAGDKPSNYSNIVTAKTNTGKATATRFYNNSSYPIIYLTIDGVQYFPNSPQGIAPGSSYEVALSPGSHSYEVWNGFWDGPSRFEMYSWSGTISQQQGGRGEVRIADPTITQLLTRFTGQGVYWEGTYWDDNAIIHRAGFCFRANGSWTLYNDGAPASNGSYSLSSRNPSTFSVGFSTGSSVGTLYELYGYFYLRNGPSSWPIIQYYATGQSCS